MVFFSPERNNQPTIRNDMTIDSSIAAVILSAGFSERMGRFKPLLPLGTRTIIERVVNTFQSAGIGEILVVTGYRAADVRQAVSALPVRCVANTDYMKGMFSSVLAGIQRLSEDCRAFFVHPADIPLVKPQTIRQLAGAFGEDSPVVLYPTFDGRRGHPPLIAASLIPRILMWSGSGGLRAVLTGHHDDSAELAVNDEGILMDLDTPEDYQRMRTRFRL
jgi:CTP:molybdopterin cytidylyltransferase MocA